MKIIYKDEYHTAEFDKQRYLESLKRYGTADEEKFEKAVKEKIECYPTPHVSVLIRVGVNLIQEEEGARKYLEEHPIEGTGFERLRRITGYLVGTVARWNDFKKAELKDRVIHSVPQGYSQVDKAIREELKQQDIVVSQV